MSNEPRVYILAHTEWAWEKPKPEPHAYTHFSTCWKWLSKEHPGGEHSGLALDAERIVEAAGRRCYRSFATGLNKNVTTIREDPKDYIRNLLKQGHGSVLEHFNVTVAFEGVSRVFTHELVRHRAGCAYSQESLRYVRAEPGFQMVMPGYELEQTPYAELKDAVDQYLGEANKVLDRCQTFREKKELTSAIRRMLPQGMATGIVATFNMRALRHIIRLRTSEAAEWEMRVVVGELARQCKERFPLLLSDMTTVDASDGGAPVYQFEFAA